MNMQGCTVGEFKELKTKIKQSGLDDYKEWVHGQGEILSHQEGEHFRMRFAPARVACEGPFFACENVRVTCEISWLSCEMWTVACESAFSACE